MIFQLQASRLAPISVEVPWILQASSNTLEDVGCSINVPSFLTGFSVWGPLESSNSTSLQLSIGGVDCSNDLSIPFILFSSKPETRLLQFKASTLDRFTLSQLKRQQHYIKLLCSCHCTLCANYTKLNPQPYNIAWAAFEVAGVASAVIDVLMSLMTSTRPRLKLMR